MNSDTISTTILEQGPDGALRQAWGDFMRRADYPTHYVGPEYFHEPDATERRFLAVLAFRGPTVVGVLTGEHQHRHFIAGLNPRPQLAFDRAEDKSEIARHLVRGLLSHQRRASLVDICSWEPLPVLQTLGFWRRRTANGVVILDLTKGLDQLQKEMTGTCRTAIKKGIKSGVEVREATESDLDEYLRIRDDWARRKHLPLPDHEMHRRLLQLRNVRRLFVAIHNGEVIAGSIVRFSENAMMEYAANSSRTDKMALRPNDVLQWRIIEWGCANGFGRYSLAGSHPFLVKFGGETIWTCAYRFDRSFLRRHRLREVSTEAARAAFHRLPQFAKTRLRRLGEDG